MCRARSRSPGGMSEWSAGAEPPGGSPGARSGRPQCSGLILSGSSTGGGDGIMVKVCLFFPLVFMWADSHHAPAQPALLRGPSPSSAFPVASFRCSIQHAHKGRDCRAWTWPRCPGQNCPSSRGKRSACLSNELPKASPCRACLQPVISGRLSLSYPEPRLHSGAPFQSTWEELGVALGF